MNPAKADDAGATEAFEKWWADYRRQVEERTGQALKSNIVEAMKEMARIVWKSGVDWADGKATIGMEEGGVTSVAIVRVLALGENGIYTSMTNVVTVGADDEDVVRDMPNLLTIGCGNAVTEVLARMGYTDDGTGQMVKVGGPERVV